MLSVRITALWALLLGGVLASPLSPRGTKTHEEYEECCEIPECQEDPCEPTCQSSCDGYCGTTQCDDPQEFHHYHYPPYPYPQPAPQPAPVPVPVPIPNPAPNPTVCNTQPIVNGNFNTGTLTPFVANNAAGVTVVQSPAAAGGNFAAQFALAQAAAPGLSISQQNVQICAGRTYQFSATVASDQTAATAACTLMVTLGGQMVYNQPITPTAAGGAATNVPVTATFLAPATSPATGAFVSTVTCANPPVVDPTNPTAQGFVYLDNITLTPL